MLERLGAKLRSVFTRRPSGPSVVLRPMEQVAMLYLHRFSRATPRDLYQELNATSGASHAEAGEAIVRLLEAGLVEARFQPDEDRSDVTYVLTRRGERLKGRIPPEPRSVTEFWF